MGDEDVTGARDALLVVVARLEGKFDTSMAELRAGVAAVSQQFVDHVRRTEEKQRDLETRLERKADVEHAKDIERKVDTLWDRYNLQRGVGIVVTAILAGLSVYAALRASGVHL